MVKALVAAAALPALALAVPAPPQATTHPLWRRDVDARLQREPRGFTSSSGVHHLPLIKRRRASALPDDVPSYSRRLRKRQGGQAHSQGLGDDLDLAYQLALNVGGSEVYFQVDSGSSDLWAVTSQCNSATCSQGTQGGLPRYDQGKDNSFVSTGLPIVFNYGTSAQPTNASGVLARTTITAAGFQIQNATFSAINETNNNVAADSAGIFGVGFPVISRAVTVLFNASLSSNASLASASAQEQALAYAQSWIANGPALARLALTGQLAQPGFALSLQRILDPETSNAGLITVGGLPDGVSNSSMTYVPVFQYPGPNQIPFRDIASAVPRLPASFDVPIDSVQVNGHTLPNSTSGGEVVQEIGVYGLMDSGTTAIAGPQDLVTSIYQTVGYDQQSGTVPCDTKLEVTLNIGGKPFPINPIDWLQPSNGNDTTRCSFLLSVNDAPSGTEVSSWIFGDVFLKNVLTFFYYGSQDQTADPAKIGFLSTTDAQAASSRFDSLLPSSASGSLVSTPFSVLSNAPPSATTSLGNPVSAASATASGGGNGGSGGNGGTSGSSGPSASAKNGAAGLSVSFGAALLAGLVAVMAA